MLKKILRDKSAFERYFKEADDDEDKVSVTVAPRRNRGTDYGDDTNNIRVVPHQRRGTDYGDGMNNDGIDDASNNIEDVSTDPNNTGEPSEENEPVSEPDLGEGGTDYGADDTGDDGGIEEDEDMGDKGDTAGGPDLGDGGTDYGDDTGDSGEDGDASETSEETPSENSPENPEDADERLKKYHMYKRYMNLYNIIDTFIEKLRNIVKSNAVENAVIKRVYNNLTDVHTNMFDYMTIKFKKASYVEVLIYFETVISIVRLNFELIRNNKINLKQ